jgi:hypothetical protein
LLDVHVAEKLVTKLAPSSPGCNDTLAARSLGAAFTAIGALGGPGAGFAGSDTRVIAPTPTHDVALAHDTLARLGPNPAFGLGTSAQVAPFQDSTSVLLSPN